MTLVFRTENVDVEVFNKAGNYEGHATIEWEIEFETRQHCLKGGSVIIKKIECVLTPDEGDDIQVNTILLPFAEWNIESEVKFDDDAACCPNNVQFDFKDKTITVS